MLGERAEGGRRTFFSRPVSHLLSRLGTGGRLAALGAAPAAEVAARANVRVRAREGSRVGGSAPSEGDGACAPPPSPSLLMGLVSNPVVSDKSTYVRAMEAGDSTRSAVRGRSRA